MMFAIFLSSSSLSKPGDGDRCEGLLSTETYEAFPCFELADLSSGSICMTLEDAWGLAGLLLERILGKSAILTPISGC